MSRYTRPTTTGATVFFTVALADRRSTCLVAQIDRLRTAVRDTLAARPVRIEAMVVLPDHLHAIWTLPAGDKAYGRRWGEIKARFVKGLPPVPLRQSHVARRERGIWQRRFWEHHVRDEASLRALRTYCWMNPVKHGLVSDPQDWPYSSLHRDKRFPGDPQEWCAVAHPTALSLPEGAVWEPGGPVARPDLGPAP